LLKSICVLDIGDVRVLNEREPLLLFVNVVINLGRVAALRVAPNVLVVENNVYRFVRQFYFRLELLRKSMRVLSACLFFF
jgi:hypothetical protein